MNAPPRRWLILYQYVAGLCDTGTGLLLIVAPAWTLTGVIDWIVGAVIRRNEIDIARRYQGSAWCDSTEHDLNYDIMTGRRTRS